MTENYTHVRKDNKLRLKSPQMTQNYANVRNEVKLRLKKSSIDYKLM